MADTPRQILESYKQKVIDALTESLIANDRQASAKLLQSVDVKIKVFATNMEFVVVMEDYWKYVEYGRAKGKKMPPMDAMLKHIANRGVNYKSLQTMVKNKQGQLVKRKKPLPKDKALKTLAFLMGRKIKKTGIKATNFIEEAFESGVIDNLTRDLSKALAREIVLDLKFKE